MFQKITNNFLQHRMILRHTYVGFEGYSFKGILNLF